MQTLENVLSSIMLLFALRYACAWQLIRAHCRGDVRSIAQAIEADHDDVHEIFMEPVLLVSGVAMTSASTVIETACSDVQKFMKAWMVLDA